MRTRRLVLSDAAIADVLEQADWYAFQAGQSISQTLGESGHIGAFAHSQSACCRYAMRVPPSSATGSTADHYLRISQTSAFLSLRP